MNPCRCLLISENPSEIASLISFMKLYDFVLLESRNRTTQDCEMFLVDLDTVDLKDWQIRQKEEAWEEIPFLCLSSDVSESRQASAFLAGAQDILSSDLHPALVCRRVISLLRILPALHPVQSQRMSKFHLPAGFMIEIDRNTREISMDSQNLHFTPREWEIFLLLVNKLNRVVSRDAILDAIQDDSLEGTDRMVDSHIKNIRKKLKDRSAIVTERGYGYKLRGLMG